ncbi:MAG: hypothetical protein HW374_1779 [Bacteroidetes bacterium]|nr:hypothetical protein [Bacteroidota bacterium]
MAYLNPRFFVPIPPGKVILMRNHLRAVQLLWFFVFFLVLKAEGQTPFLGLQIESMGLDTLYRPYDSDNPKAKLRVINTAGSNSPAGIQCPFEYPQVYKT